MYTLAREREKEREIKRRKKKQRQKVLSRDREKRCGCTQDYLTECDAVLWNKACVCFCEIEMSAQLTHGYERECVTCRNLMCKECKDINLGPS